MSATVTLRALVAPPDVLGALAGARRVELSAYVLAPGGAVGRALEAAADRGADVSITLETFADRPPGDGLRREAEGAARAFAAHGIRVRAGAGGETAHLKAAVIDGTAYLDDRNWTAANDTIVATATAADVAAIRDALDAGDGARAEPATGLALDKDAALALEASVVRGGSGDRVDLESESFGACAVSKALRERAATGAHVRLLVNGSIARAPRADRERALLHRLAAAGVEIRLTSANEKLCVAGDRGWVGSANATFSVVPTTDWGLEAGSRPVVEALAATFAREWSAARPFR